MVEIEKIKALISNKEENEFCDFKEKWPKELCGIVKDIICFSNRVSDNDAYIILGVRDNDKAVVGIENTENRFNQAMLTEYLRKVPFADIRPQIKVDVVTIEAHELDIITIKNCKETPIYLTKNFKGIKSGFIYTRINDCNSPEDESLEPGFIELLWKKRFNLLNRLTPKEQFLEYLKDIANWEQGISQSENINSLYYYKFDPLYKIYLKDDTETRKSIQEFSVNQLDPKIGYVLVECSYSETILYSKLAIWLDGARFIEMYPEQTVPIETNREILVNYFLKDSPSWIIRNFLITEFDKILNQCPYDREKFLDTVICFENEEEKRSFFCYLNTTVKEIKPLEVEISGSLGVDNKTQNIEFYKDGLKFTLAVNKIFKDWKSHK